MGNPSSSSSPLLLLPPPNSSSNPPSPTLKTTNPESAAAPDSSSPPSQTQTQTQTQKKSTPLPWTHQETLNLIQSYQEKWYSLKKGQLKAHQWEDVASSVAARCGYDEPYKTATQCRHKIEKLRKRYRTERSKAYPNSWQYFELMDRMERGPLPISAARPVSAAPVEYRNLNSGGNYNETDSEDDDVDYGPVDVKKKSINHIVRGDLGLSSNINGRGGGNSNQRGMRSLRTPVTMKRKGYYENDVSDDEEVENDEEEEEEEDGEEKEGSGGGTELAAAIRGFAESFMRMENKKIEMMRATESYRMEMEKKRMDMILESQRKIVDTIGKAIGAHKKVKMDHDI